MDLREALLYEVYYEDKIEFTLKEAASAWAGIQPIHKIKNSRGIPEEAIWMYTVVKKRLFQACKEGRLRYSYPPANGYIVKGKQISHKGIVYKLGNPIELTEDEAEKHGDKVEPLLSLRYSHLITISITDLRKFAKNIELKPRPYFLFPKEKRHQELPQESHFNHSPDYISVKWKEETFTFTSRQAQVVEILHKGFLNGTPDVGQAYILENLGSPNSRLKDTFKNHSAWGTFIVPGEKRSTRRLNI